MPQLDIFMLCSLVIFTSFFLLVLMFFMHTYFVPKIAASLKARNFLTQFIDKTEKKPVFDNQQKTQIINLNKSLLSVIKNKITKN